MNDPFDSNWGLAAAKLKPPTQEDLQGARRMLGNQPGGRRIDGLRGQGPYGVAAVPLGYTGGAASPSGHRGQASPWPAGMAPPGIIAAPTAEQMQGARRMLGGQPAGRRIDSLRGQGPYGATPVPLRSPMGAAPSAWHPSASFSPTPYTQEDLYSARRMLGNQPAGRRIDGLRGQGPYGVTPTPFGASLGGLSAGRPPSPTYSFPPAVPVPRRRGGLMLQSSSFGGGFRG